MKIFRALVKLNWQELMSDRLVSFSLGAALIIFSLSFLFGSLSFSEQYRLLIHFGLLAIYLPNLLLVCFMASFALPREIERQTCHLILARHVSRPQFYLAKWFGLFTFNAANIIILGFILWTLLEFKVSVSFLLGILSGLIFETSLLLTLAMFLSLWVRPALTMLLTIAIWLVGNEIQDFLFFSIKAGYETPLFIAKIVEKTFPNLFCFNWRSVYFLENGISLNNYLWALTHAVAWITLSLSLGVLSFRRKDLVPR